MMNLWMTGVKLLPVIGYSLMMVRYVKYYIVGYFRLVRSMSVLFLAHILYETQFRLLET